MIFGQFGLFLGTFFDAVIGPNLFVAGEPFLLAAGYQLHRGEWTGLLVVLLGGFLGDQTSFFIGRYFGFAVRRKIMKWYPGTRRTVARSHLLMRRNGNKVLAFARLLGPVSWIVPFLAGTEKIGWKRFTLFSFLGLILGVGQFIVWGYLLAAGAERFSLLMDITTYMNVNGGKVLAIGFLLLLALGYWKHWVVTKKH